VFKIVYVLVTLYTFHAGSSEDMVEMTIRDYNTEAECFAWTMMIRDELQRGFIDPATMAFCMPYHLKED
jgi:hypothetical protein